MAAALVHELAGGVWPNADDYLKSVEPKIRTLLTSWDLERAYKLNLLFRPWLLLRGRANVIAKLIHGKWHIRRKVGEMSMLPEWVINTTCYETGKNYRFERSRMGDYLTQYVINPDFPLSEAVAASAAVPGLIGPLSVKTKRFQWLRYAPGDWVKSGAPHIPVSPISPRIQLWDGGVYDNLGIEPVYKPGTGLLRDVNFLIVSDASKPLGIELRRFKIGMPPYIAPIRLVDAATDQVRSLRARAVVEYLDKKPGSGVYLRMGNSADFIYSECKKPLGVNSNSDPWLTQAQIGVAASMHTTLRKLTCEEFTALAAHGFEVCNATLDARLNMTLV